MNTPIHAYLQLLIPRNSKELYILEEVKIKETEINIWILPSNKYLSQGRMKWSPSQVAITPETQISKDLRSQHESFVAN